jgi:molecular chaperone GrpE
MVDETTNSPGSAGQGAAAQSAPAEELRGQEAAPASADQLAAEVGILKGQVADLTDRLLRAHAEMDNMRKRSEREREETAKYAITRFAGEIVAVADTFERAAAAVPQEAAERDPALRSFLDGVTIAEREFLNVLERHGVKRLDPKGEMFSPHLHQAMMEVENADVPAGTILQVFQPGYRIEDRVLRPAMVVVAKGGQKPTKAADDASAAPSSDGGSAPNL